MSLSRKVVQPPGTLRVVPEGKRDQVLFSKRYGLRNEYVNDMLKTGRWHKDWQRLGDAQWLQNIETGEIVVVGGEPTYFLKNVAAHREDMSFDKWNFPKWLTGKYVDRSGNPFRVYKGWEKLEHMPEQVAALEDGATLIGLSGEPVPAPAPAPILLPDYGTGLLLPDYGTGLLPTTAEAQAAWAHALPRASRELRDAAAGANGALVFPELQVSARRAPPRLHLPWHLPPHFPLARRHGTRARRRRRRG